MDPGQTRITRQPHRIGPISRAVRIAITVLLLWLAGGLISEGIAGFSEPPVPGQPVFWLITVWAFVTVHDVVRVLLRRPGWPVVGGVIVLTLAAGVTATIMGGRLWAAPLTWVVYAVDLGVATLVLLGYAASVVLGTPGCDQAALREAIDRLSGRYDPATASLSVCAGGLHRLDSWEADRMRRHSSGC